MAQPSIQTSFASGEWAPKLRARVDVAKYRTGAALLRNFYVDFAGGGASTRPGTEFIAQAGANGARLIPFQPSSNVSYVLEFGNFYIRFYSNGAQVLSGGIPYQITSPYAAADLFPNQTTGNPGIKFVQDVTSLIICHPNYAPQILTINSPTNWSITAISFLPTLSPPLNPNTTTTLGAGSWHYGYRITAVDQFGHESLPSEVALIDSVLPLESTAGRIGLTWNQVFGATSYNVYKALGQLGVVIADTSMFGFIANVAVDSFVDSQPGVTPDMSQTIPVFNNPFAGGAVTGASVTTAGIYTSVPTITIAAPTLGYQAYGYPSLGVTVAVTNALILANPSAQSLTGLILNFPNGVVLSVLTSHNTSGANYQIDTVAITSAGSITAGPVPASGTPGPIGPPPGVTYVSGSVTLTWGVTAIVIQYGGTGYTALPGITFSSGAAVAVTIIGAAGNPGVPSFFQERLVLAAQVEAPQTVNLSKPGDFFNFNYTIPSEDDDSITAQIIGEELNDIRWLVPVSTGIIAGTGQGAWQINGGGGVSSASPITPANFSAQAQAFNGTTDIQPIKINLDILYVTNKGNYVRDFAFNIYANIYTGSDISTISNHLFFGYQIVDWTWAEEPFKTLWAVRNDGIMLSLGYVKEQELIGWAHHDTDGQFLSVTSVIENVNGNTVDAVYVLVQRLINGSLVQYVERLADRFFAYGYEDSWAVDCGLQTNPSSTISTTLTITGNASAIGNTVTLTDSAGAPFTSGMASGNFIVRAGGGIYQITGFTSTSSVTAVVQRVPRLLDPYTSVPYPVTARYTIWTPVNTVSGLTQLVGQTVVGVVDGTPVGPLTVSGGGSVSLGMTGTKITLGLAFLPQMQTLPLDMGEPTVQGKRKKITGVTLRVADALGLQIGTSFANAVAMKDFILNNVGTQSNGVVTDLISGDGRTIIDQVWQEAGNYCIQQNLPYPATVLGAMPEVTVGDTPK
jgi:hypothetical protein